MKRQSSTTHRNVLTLVLKNSLAWFTIHMGVAWLITRLPMTLFHPEGWLFRSRKWENNGQWYNRVGVSQWKNSLPDGATWLIGGFPKKRLRAEAPDYVQRFVRETCRGELVHWVVIALTPVFLLWNSFSSFLIMIAYALISNMPCIIAQRYNRPRLQSLLKRLQKSRSSVSAENRSGASSGDQTIHPLAPSEERQ
ncbi:MAG: glycosyl-4,4'-diaponeurosporenoate acyltransferase [Chitinivibrionales bacterium]